MRRYVIVAAGLLLSLVLGATVFREQAAWAAQAVDARIVGPLDAQGNVKVHEQGTAAIRSADHEVSITRRYQSSGQLCDGTFYTVPAGQDLVVEYISAGGFVHGPDGSAEGGFSSGIGATVMPLVFETQGVTGITAASEAIHYVISSGTTLQFAALIDSGGCLFDASMGGYLQPSS